MGEKASTMIVYRQMHTFNKPATIYTMCRNYFSVKSHLLVAVVVIFVVVFGYCIHYIFLFTRSSSICMNVLIILKSIQAFMDCKLHSAFNIAQPFDAHVMGSQRFTSTFESAMQKKNNLLALVQILVMPIVRIFVFRYYFFFIFNAIYMKLHFSC